jgi:hypothetical protein
VDHESAARWISSKAPLKIAPNILSLAHENRLLGGELYATTSRLDWATLLKRTFDTDIRVCVRCGGRLTVRRIVQDPDDVERVLAGLQRGRAPPAGPPPPPIHLPA